MSLTISEKTGMLFETGMKPDLKPVTFDMTVLMGAQGEEKADWTTEWFYPKYVGISGCLGERMFAGWERVTFAINWN